MILPAPFGYENEYKYVETVTGERCRLLVKQRPVRRPHTPVFAEWTELLDGVDSEMCLICGHDRYDEMHQSLEHPTPWDEY